MRSLLTLPGSFGILRVEPRNSSEKVRQHLKRGLFFGVRTLEKYGVYSVISGREWANRIPCKGEYARRSLTVSSSRPFLRPAIGQHRKIREVPMHYFPLSRPARCGGVSSLESVLRKLARAGEASALAGLLRLPLSLATRVRWAAFGTLLSLEVL